MENSNEIGLLIFDLDGTLFKSDKSNIEAVKKAVSQLNAGIPVDEEKIRMHLGEVSDRFYKNLLPKDKIFLWQELRIKTREQYLKYISEFGELFPDVIKTLKTLKKRGYKLALCSNCGILYLDSVLSNFDIGDYFDYMECVGENNLTKSEIIEKIKNKFPDLKPAIIGDRIHDIEAARKTDSLSIGALYGYGRDEPKEADIQINKFSELLDIFL